MRIPKVLVQIAGTISTILGLLVGISQTIALFSLVKAHSYALFLQNHRMLAETGGLVVLAVSNVFMSLFAFFGGIQLIFPAWAGQHPGFGFTGKKIESIRGVYKGSGRRLVLFGALSLAIGVSLSVVAHFFSLYPAMVILPLIVIVCGTVGLLAGWSRGSPGCID